MSIIVFVRKVMVKSSRYFQIAQLLASSLPVSLPRVIC